MTATTSHQDPDPRVENMRKTQPALASLAETMAHAVDDSHAQLFDIVLDVIEHAHLIEGAHGGSELWAKVANMVGRTHSSDSFLRDAVALNTVGLLLLRRPADIQALTTLVQLSDHNRVAEIQNKIDGFADSPPGLPWTTALIRTLQAPNLFIVDAKGISVELDAAELAMCAEAALTLLLTGIDVNAGEAPDPILTVGGLEHTAQHDNAHTWRLHLARIAHDPWGPDSRPVLENSRHSSHPHIEATTAKIFERLRDRIEREERQTIANHVRELVHLSGLSQRAFAARIGTSASRMSTYVNGQVTPSATLLLRMTRVTAKLAADSATSSEPLLLSR